ncbi:MAG: adenosylcobinamide-GDP ribazoletransferase [Fervidobacterium sp.]
MKKVFKGFIEDFLLTLTFLSRIPISLNSEAFKRIRNTPTYFPLIGYMPGIIYYFGTHLVAKNTGSTFYVFFSMVLGFYLFDLFHFDGLLDMFDGFLNQSTKERRLEIMSKGNVGAFAVFYGTLYVIAFWELLKISRPVYFLLASVFGRYTMVVTLYFSKPAKREGLGAMFYPYSKKRLYSAVISTFPLFFFKPLGYVLAMITSILVGIIISYISEKKIGGITGDVIGGSCLLSQLFILFTLNGLLK